MKVIFWQNLLSPHQLPYITHIMDDISIEKVVIVAGENVNISREKMGWKPYNINDESKTQILIAPNDDDIYNLIADNTENSWHLFSGIRGFKFVFKAFKISLKFNINRGLITERPNTFALGFTNGKPLWLHRIRFLLQDRIYAKYIKKVFAMGDAAVDYYKSIYKNWEVIPFAYCTKNELPLRNNINKGGVNFCFVGSLSWWKSPQSIVKAAIKIKRNINISFIGSGNEEDKIQHLIKDNKYINSIFYGFQDNTKVQEILAKQDVLILPSIYDGWGAVVNEALNAGLYVICSDKCGAKELISNPKLGYVFKSNNITELSESMNYCLENIDEIRNNRIFRQEWAKRCISGEVISKYFVECLNNRQVIRPWFKD